MRSVNQVCDELNGLFPFAQLAKLLPDAAPFYLVGGALRDLFLGRACSDLDFAAAFDPTALARTLARNFGGRWFFLDESRRQSRILLPFNDTQVSCDFAPLRSPGLLEDLKLRDFTINAMTMRVRGETQGEDFYDPLCGLGDLGSGRLRICSRDVLKDDPLRILKGLRHWTNMGVEPCPDTLSAMRAAACGIAGVAAERIHRETGLLFDHVRPALVYRRLVSIGLHRYFFGEVHACKNNEIVAALEMLGRNIQDMQTNLFFQTSIGHSLEEGMTRRAAFNLTMILRAIEPAAAKTFLLNQKFSRTASRAIRGYLELAFSRLSDVQRLCCGARGRYWWTADLGHDAVGCLLFLAAAGWHQNRRAALEAIAMAREFTVAAPLRDLVDGRCLLQRFGVEPGPETGRALRALRREEIAGRVCNIRQAYTFLEKRCQKTH